MANLAWFLISVATGPTPAVVPPEPVKMEEIVVKAPSIPVETKDGAKAWFHPSPGSQ